MSMEIVRSLPEEKWRRFVDDHPAGNIFHTPEMFRVFSRTKGCKPTLWAVVNNDRPLALLPVVQLTLFNSLLRRLTTRAVAYGGLLCAPDSEGTKALPMLLEIYKKETRPLPLFTELRNLADTSELKPLLNDSGFIYADHLNYLIALNRPPEAILQSIGRRTRKHIRREIRKGKVIIEEVDRREGLPLFYELLKRTYAAARLPLADRSLFEAAFDILYPRNMVKYLLAKVDQEYAACSAELIYKDGIYGWYGGIHRAYNRSNPNELLMWYILRWGSANGYRVYDFGGAGTPGEQYKVRDFKAKFGGTLVCFGRNTYVHSPFLLRLSEIGYRIYRHLR